MTREEDSFSLNLLRLPKLSRCNFNQARQKAGKKMKSGVRFFAADLFAS